MSSILNAIQQSAADRLLSDPFFSDIEVLTERVSEIEHRIDAALARLGVAVIVVTATAHTTMFDVPGPYLDKIMVVCRVIENVTLNSTGKTAAEIAERCAALLHLHTPAESGAGTFKVDRQAITLAPSEGVLSYDVAIWTEAQFLLSAPPQVAAPVITNTAGSISITCTTGGAAIFYTTDGTNPMPRSGTLYSAPFIPGAVTVRARAWLAGYLASDLTSLTT